MKNTLIIIAAALALTCFNACRDSEEKRISNIVESKMASMTLEQKVAQLFMIQIDRNNWPELRAQQDSLVKMGLGGIIIMRGPIAPFMDRMNELQSDAEIPLVVATDAEWGAAMRFMEYPAFPKQFELSKMPDSADLLYEMGLDVAAELKDLNIHINLAPVADMVEVPTEDSQPREFGFGVQHATEYADAYMRGMQDGGISACAKHFPSHGDTNIDTHVEKLWFNYSREHADTTYLVPFKKMIDNGVDVVMMGHHAVFCYDSTMTPSSISWRCVNELLRRDLGFKGIVTTDALGMGGVLNGRTPLEVNVAAYKAGIDMLLMPLQPIESIRAIADSVSCGRFPLEDLDARVRKMLTFKAKKGFFEEGYSPYVTDLDTKIKEAMERDSVTIKKMNAEILKASGSIRYEDYVDPTLQMDRGRD